MTGPTGTDVRRILGIPVEGDVISKRENQRTLEEFQAIFHRVVDNGEVIDFGWRQYTPYRDGEERCDFESLSFWINSTYAPEGLSQYELKFPQRKHGLGERNSSWRKDNEGNRIHVFENYEGPDEELYDAVYELYGAIEGGCFIDVLFNLFGEHAEVTVSREKINIDFYEHS